MTPLTAFLITYPGMALAGMLIPLLAVRWFLAPADRKRTEWILVVAALIEPAGILSQLIANALSALRPFKLDLYIYQIDALFGAPSFRLGQLVVHRLWLAILTSVAYGLLPMTAAGVFAAYLYMRSDREALRVAAVFAINLFAAVPIYLLIPVCGPIFAFSSFPALPPADLAPHLVAIAAAPNGIPSVHMSTALLALWFLRKWCWGRVAGSIYLALIVVATLGSGQHYLVDLVCAVPYVALILLATRKLFAAKLTAEVAA